jgi:hypothetical protein
VTSSGEFNTNNGKKKCFFVAIANWKILILVDASGNSIIVINQKLATTSLCCQ